MVVPFIRTFLNHVYRWRNWDKDNSKDKFNNLPGVTLWQLMEQRCSCCQLPFGDHICKVTKVNSQVVLYTLTQGAGPREHISCKKLAKKLSICRWFSPGVKTEMAPVWGEGFAAEQQYLIMIKVQDLLSCQRVLRTPCWSCEVFRGFYMLHF